MKAYLIAVTDLEVVFDNGGGITLQCDEYCHFYEGNATQAAQDFKILLEGGSPADWEGNEEEFRIYPTHDEIANGGYEVMTAEEIAEILEDGEIETSSNNVGEFFRALDCEVE